MRGTVLVVGASGLVGAASVDAFLDAGWPVVALSRRRPEVFSSEAFRHLAVDLKDPSACLEAVKELAGVTHVVYTAVYEEPGLVAGWQSTDQMDTNLAMLCNLLDPLSAAADLQHVTLLQGTKAYGVHRHPIRIPSRESEPRDPHPNFYWLQEDHLRELAARNGFAWTILRPQLIVGPNHGVAMNLPPVIGAFAAVCRAERRPFGFPGGLPYVTEAVDTRLVADAALWAAAAPQAWGEHFNLTNGEVFEWRDMWRAIADVLGVEPAEDAPVRLGEFLPTKAAVWDAVVQEHGLRPLSLSQLLGESHHYADFCFAHGAKRVPAPAFLSTVKIKQAGFCQTYDSEQSMRHWLQVLIDRRILPPPA
jgi:nucleoside-diphosphate-sugar epimerase